MNFEKEKEKILGTLYTRFHVTLKFRDRVYGGLPSTQEEAEAYVLAKFKSDDASKVLEDHPSQLPTSEVEDSGEVVKEKEYSSTVFKRTEKGLFLGDYLIKGGLKHYASLLRLTIKKRGSSGNAGFKDTVKEALFVKGTLDDGQTLTGKRIYFQPLRIEADGLEQFTGNVGTQQGERSILKYSEYVEKALITFQIWVAAARMTKKTEFTAEDLVTMLLLGQEVGFGSNRTFEAGKYELVDFTQI